MISPEALEKAWAIVADWQGRHDVVLPIAAFRELVAALQAAPKLPDDLAGLVEQLEKRVLALRCVLKQTATTKYDADLSERAAATIQSLVARNAELEAGLDCLVNAKALSGVRELVAGWNGENQPDGPYAERHPARLGATLPKTNCGAVYALDDAMQTARSLLNKDRQP